MYKSKAQGKNIWSLYNNDLHEKTLRHASIISGLRGALKTGSLDLYFQPKTNIATGKTIGAEALLRWSRNNPYKIFPDEFIPVIESTDLIIDIGAWVIEEACLVCKRWHDSGHKGLRVAVNVSVMQLSRNNLKPIIEAALANANLEARFLEIELFYEICMKGH